MRFFPAFVSLTIVLLSCLGNENEKAYTYHPDDVFHDYRISGEEGKDDVTIVLQHRLGGLNEDPAFLENSKISLDGTELKADSAKLAGTFYEVQRPAVEFEGNHTIRFVDNRGEEHKLTFEYQPFSFKEEIAEQMVKKPFTLRLKNFPSGASPVQLVMVDTSFASRDVNEELNVRNGELTISEEQLANLSYGPIAFELHIEKELPLENFSKKGGRILITYSLRRQFEFVRK